MTAEQWYDEMAEVALGWLGWSERQTLHSDINAIAVALKGHIQYLKMIHGSADPNDRTYPNWIRKRPKTQRRAPVEGDGKPIVLTPTAFDATFGSTKRGGLGKVLTKK